MRNSQSRTIVLLLLALSTGCSALQKKDDGVERDWLGREKEIEYTIPSKVVAIWSNSVFNEAGKAPVRGLGGRVYFYNAEHHPVRVDGKLSVFLYDDTDAEPNEKLNQKATKVEHFTAEQVRSNYSPSEFGSSYSFWVPWDSVDGERKQLSVIPVFTDATGHMLVGEQARHLLPGSEPVKVTDENGQEVIQASFVEHSTKTVQVHNGDLDRSESVSGGVLGKSSTIKLPSSMQERLRREPPRRSARSWDMRERTRLTRDRNDEARSYSRGFEVSRPTASTSQHDRKSEQGEAMEKKSSEAVVQAGPTAPMLTTTSTTAGLQSIRSQQNRPLAPFSQVSQQQDGPSRTPRFLGGSLFDR